MVRPVGKLKVSIQATWLKDARVDMDALTELSFGTHRSTEAGEALQDGDEQVQRTHEQARAPLLVFFVAWLLSAALLVRQSSNNSPRCLLFAHARRT